MKRLLTRFNIKPLIALIVFAAVVFAVGVPIAIINALTGYGVY